MGSISAYVRPATLDGALDALGRPGAVVAGGGTKVNAGLIGEPTVFVDLQALGLGDIRRSGDDELRIGATATLQQLAEDPEVPPAVREAARREEPSTLRSLATVGGCVATARPDSELLAVLLVHGAQVTLAGHDGVRALGLDDLLADLGQLTGRVLTTVTLQTGGVTATARTARTGADRPIVAAIARRATDGTRHLALTGVAATPVLVAPSGEALDGLEPPADFRGSGEYRRALAGVLARRALEEIG